MGVAHDTAPFGMGYLLVDTLGTSSFTVVSFEPNIPVPKATATKRRTTMSPPASTPRKPLPASSAMTLSPDSRGKTIPNRQKRSILEGVALTACQRGPCKLH